MREARAGKIFFYIIFLIVLVTFVGGCVTKPYFAPAKRITQKGDIIDQYINYVNTDSQLTEKQKEIRVDRAEAFKLYTEKVNAND